MNYPFKDENNDNNEYIIFSQIWCRIGKKYVTNIIFVFMLYQIKRLISIMHFCFRQKPN